MGALDCRGKGRGWRGNDGDRERGEARGRRPDALPPAQGGAGGAQQAAPAPQEGRVGADHPAPSPAPTHTLSASQQASLGRQSQSQATVPVLGSPKNTRPCRRTAGSPPPWMTNQTAQGWPAVSEIKRPCKQGSQHATHDARWLARKVLPRSSTTATRRMPHVRFDISCPRCSTCRARGEVEWGGVGGRGALQRPSRGSTRCMGASPGMHSTGGGAQCEITEAHARQAGQRKYTWVGRTRWRTLSVASKRACQQVRKAGPA